MRYAFILGVLFAATAANAQWEIQSAPTASDLRGIHALGNGIAWASGSDGTVLRTADDGAHWQLCPMPPGAEQLDFRGIQAFDANTAIVMSTGKGPLSRLYKTTDACQTWKLVFINPDAEGSFDALSFSGTDHVVYSRGLLGSAVRHPDIERHVLSEFGYLLGDPVDGSFRTFHTYDRGSTWLSSQDKFVAKGGETAFAASNQSLLTMQDNFDNMLFITGGSVSRLLYNYDGCEFDGLWCYRYTPTVHLPLAHGDETSGAFAMAILPYYHSYEVKFPYTIVIVGGDDKHPEATTGVAATVYFVGLRALLGRRAWAAHTPPHGFRSAVTYDEAAKTWITVGPNGTDLSTDDGRNWRALRPNPALHEPPDANRNWNALSMPFVVGPHGRIGKLRPTALTPPPIH